MSIASDRKWDRMTEQKVLIVSGGQIEDAFVDGLLAEGQYQTVIACDSGMEYFRRAGRCPDLILGDFDSAGQETLQYFREQTDVNIERFPAKKDWTDTQLAVERALALRPQRIDLVGATGSRMDHMLGNIQMLALSHERGVPMYLLDPHNRIRLLEHAVTIRRSEQFGDYVSLLPFTECVRGITLHGMKYPLSNATLTQGVSLGISNEITDEQARIELTEGLLLVIESKD